MTQCVNNSGVSEVSAVTTSHSQLTGLHYFGALKPVSPGPQNNQSIADSCNHHEFIGISLLLFYIALLHTYVNARDKSI